MSAPVRTDPPTLPLPISQTLPPGGNWLMSEHSVLLIPATIITAVGVGALMRTYVVLTDEARSDFALIWLVAILTVWSLALGIPRTISRGRDGRS